MTGGASVGVTGPDVGDGLAAPPHAANTIAAPASKPNSDFRINAPPM
jgi:hypothetical protein